MMCLNHKIPFLAASLLPCLLVAACDSDVLYNENHDIDSRGWQIDDKQVYNFETDDTTTNYLCYIDIRNSFDYPYSNLYLNVVTIFPHGEVASDTNIEFTLAQPDGKWLGKASGRYVDGRYPLCLFHFPEAGTYQFIVSHAMRDTALVGIRNIGIHIEKN